MDTRLATRQIRLKQWAEIITDCRNSGMKVDDYIQEHGITHDQYYYWLRAVRKAALEQTENAHSFVEITDRGYYSSGSENCTAGFVPQLTLSLGSLVIGVNESTPSTLRRRTLETVSHVK